MCSQCFDTLSWPAAPQFRGTFNQLFQLTLTFFILVAQVINLIMHVTKAENSWGFRLSLGFAFVPSFFLFLGGVFLPDSPNSLLERGFPTKVGPLPSFLTPQGCAGLCTCHMHIIHGC